MGSLELLAPEYQFAHSYVCVYDDFSDAQQSNLEAMTKLLQRHGPLSIVNSSEKNPSRSIAELLTGIRSVAFGQEFKITVDVSTFTKRHLLLLLHALDDAGLWGSLRILYTEPKSYVADLYVPMSTGIKEVAPIPTFTNLRPADKPVLLVIMLGYEGDRAMALFQSIEPNETVLIVPRPAYRPEWEGRTEELNKHIVTLIGPDSIAYADSRDPLKVKSALADVLGFSSRTTEFTCLVSPLGTKPQALGLYLFWRENPASCSLIYAQPLRRNEMYYSLGSGPTWDLGIQ